MRQKIEHIKKPLTEYKNGSTLKRKFSAFLKYFLLVGIAAGIVGGVVDFCLLLVFNSRIDWDSILSIGVGTGLGAGLVNGCIAVKNA